MQPWSVASGWVGGTNVYTYAYKRPLAAWPEDWEVTTTSDPLVLIPQSNQALTKAYGSAYHETNCTYADTQISMHTKLLSGGYGEYAYKGVGQLHYEPRRAAWLRNPATEFRFIIRTSAFAQYDNDATFSHKPNPKPNSESHTKRWSG